MWRQAMAKKTDSPDGGEQLVKEQVISRADLEEARKREEESGTPWYRQLIQMKKLNFNAVNDVLNYEFHSKGARESHSNLGDLLVEHGSLSEKKLTKALAAQKRNGKLLGTVLVEEGFVSEEDIAKALCKQYGMEYAELSKTKSERDALDQVPESVAIQKEIIPVSLSGSSMVVLVSGPQAPDRLKDLGVLLGFRLMPYMTAVSDMKAEIESRYGGRKSTSKKTSKKTKQNMDAAPSETKKRKVKTKPKQEAKPMTEVTKEDKAFVSESSRFDDIAQEAQGGSVVKLVSTIIRGAVNSGATDVHLDPQEPEMRVRYRIDGTLHDVMSIPEDIESAVISRLKILADIDITETRHPQDGHISMDFDDKEFDIRVASLPTFLGERIVLRLLDQSSVLAGIGDLGLDADDEKTLARVIEQPYGMILVTGPTGSGKTTTLYSCLNEKDVMTDSIVTLEDPVEYQLSGINQVQIDPEIDLTFAHVLRASLRQDIDVLLVGEIRDPETARIAVRAAMTGHLVFSTLHTNDAPEAIVTLGNMDIPPYLISNALTAVVAQRLVRTICPDCKKSFKPSKTLLKSIRLPESTKKLYRGEGCDNCYHTGYKGRSGIFEIMEVTEAVRKMISAGEPLSKITKAARLKTMAERCRQKVKKGEVTAEEFLRAIRT
ncbi:MAG TPA: type II/IV secretion system protein [Candidatus Hydrogenedentes bacterium]|nr:type II/IV secretion system protein [Candidatus Hydrogenedentota bacterium]